MIPEAVAKATEANRIASAFKFSSRYFEIREKGPLVWWIFVPKKAKSVVRLPQELSTRIFQLFMRLFGL